MKEPGNGLSKEIVMGWAVLIAGVVVAALGGLYLIVQVAAQIQAVLP